MNKLVPRKIISVNMNPGRGKNFLFSQLPGSLLGPISRLANGYLVGISLGQIDGGVKFATHLHLVPLSRSLELYFPPYVFMA
jgi:hypothetical protein